MKLLNKILHLEHKTFQIQHLSYNFVDGISKDDSYINYSLPQEFRDKLNTITTFQKENLVPHRIKITSIIFKAILSMKHVFIHSLDAKNQAQIKLKFGNTDPLAFFLLGISREYFKPTPRALIFMQ